MLSLLRVFELSFFDFLPYFHMGSNVVWSTMPGVHVRIPWSDRVYLHCPWTVLLMASPFGTSCRFRNDQKPSNYSPALIQVGILTVGHLLEADTNLDPMGLSWKSVRHWAISRRTPDPSLPNAPLGTVDVRDNVRDSVSFCSCEARPE